MKVLEILDRLTFIPALAIQMLAEGETRAWYVHRRAGYAKDGSWIILVNLNDARAANNAYDWDSRTMTVAHEWIERNFDTLQDGDVVDVEFILKETPTPKVSERLQPFGELGQDAS